MVMSGEPRRVRGIHETLGLIDRQPISGAGALLLGSFHPPNPCSQTRSEETVIRGFGSKTAHGSEPHVPSRCGQTQSLKVPTICGYGSGRRPSLALNTVDNCLVLDAARWQRDGILAERVMCS